jgi:integrase
MLKDADAFGEFSNSTTLRAWHRAAGYVEDELTAARDRWLVEHPGQEADPVPALRTIRPYDLRHTFASQMLRATGRKDVTQKLLRHADPRTTEKYAKAAVPDWLREASIQMAGLQASLVEKAKVSNQVVHEVVQIAK